MCHLLAIETLIKNPKQQGDTNDYMGIFIALFLLIA
jgi:hypothetical protein